MKLTEQSLYTIIVNAFKRAANDATSILESYIKSNVYSQPSSIYYDRLKSRGGLISAFSHPIVNMTGNSLTIQVYDSSYITSVKSDDINKFNHHMSVGERNIGDKGPIVYKGEPISELMVEWFDRGTMGSPFHNVPAYNYFDNAFKSYGGLENFIRTRATDYILKKIT